jgi:hypothetical protein
MGSVRAEAAAVRRQPFTDSLRAGSPVGGRVKRPAYTSGRGLRVVHASGEGAYAYKVGAAPWSGAGRDLHRNGPRAGIPRPLRVEGSISAAPTAALQMRRPTCYAAAHKDDAPWRRHSGSLHGDILINCAHGVSQAL